MDIPSKPIIDVLTLLLPGLITAALLYSLTPAPRPVPFERVVQALIFTVLVQAALAGVEAGLIEIGSQVGALGAWSESIRLTWSVILAAVFAIVLAWLDNTDALHRLLRKVRITHQTSFSSEWYGVLSQANGYVVLHLNGQRRLYGWPEEWPNTPIVVTSSSRNRNGSPRTA